MSLDEMMLDQGEAQVGGDEAAPAPATPSRIDGVLTGVLIGFKESGAVPLVIFPGQPQSAAIAACTTVDLQGAHIGRQVVLMFDGGNPMQPIVMGCIRGEATALAQQPGQVEVDASVTTWERSGRAVRCRAGRAAGRPCARHSPPPMA